MGVDKSTAKILAYSFLAFGIAAFCAAFFYYTSDPKLSRKLLYLVAILLAAAAASGMAWKQVATVQILNFISAIFASGLVAYGGYYEWDFAPLSIAAGIGVMTCMEFLVD